MLQVFLRRIRFFLKAGPQMEKYSDKHARHFSLQILKEKRNFVFIPPMLLPVIIYIMRGSFLSSDLHF